MAGFSNRNLSKLQQEIYLIDRVEPRWVVRVYNVGGQARNFKVGSGQSADGPFAGPSSQWTALTGTVDLTNGVATLAGTATAFDTELAVGDTVCLADGKILGRVLTIDSAVALDLDANWSGATVTGATLYLATPQEETLPNGGTSRTLVMPEDLAGAAMATHKYLLVEAVAQPISYDLSVPDPHTGVVFPVRDSLAQQSV